MALPGAARVAGRPDLGCVPHHGLLRLCRGAAGRGRASGQPAGAVRPGPPVRSDLLPGAVPLPALHRTAPGRGPGPGTGTGSSRERERGPDYEHPPGQGAGVSGGDPVRTGPAVLHARLERGDAAAQGPRAGAVLRRPGGPGQSSDCGVARGARVFAPGTAGRGDAHPVRGDDQGPGAADPDWLGGPAGAGGAPLEPRGRGRRGGPARAGAGRGRQLAGLGDAGPDGASGR